MKDVGSYKAEVAAAFIEKRVPECKVKAHTKKIQVSPAGWLQDTSPAALTAIHRTHHRRWALSFMLAST